MSCWVVAVVTTVWVGGPHGLEEAVVAAAATGARLPNSPPRYSSYGKSKGL